MPEIILTESNFEQEVLKSSVPVFVDFWAVWCGPCRMTRPAVEELGEEYDASKVKIASVNVDDHRKLAEKYGIMSIPTFMLFKNGEVVDQIIGGVSKEKMKKMIEKHV